MRFHRLIIAWGEGLGGEIGDLDWVVLGGEIGDLDWVVKLAI